MADRAHLDLMAKKLADEGRLIEAGWIGLRIAAGLERAPAVQLDEMRKAYMAGAQHLWSSLMVVMDPEAEPTPADLRRMALIQNELDAFGNELLANLPTEGNA